MNTIQQKPTAVETGMYRSAFVLPVTREGYALLACEKKGSETKYALLGGKAMAGENSFQCAARGAKEESGGALSGVSILRIARGAGVKGTPVAYYAQNQEPTTQNTAVVHDLVVKEDTDVNLKFNKQEAARLRVVSERTGVYPSIGKKRKPNKKTATEQIGLVFISLDILRSMKWREENMFTFPHSVLAARLMKSI
jgi:hypothetical protein